MRLRELFDILKHTELKQIVVGEDDNKVIGLLNLALIEVYGRFNILTEEQTIKIDVGRTRYRLQDNSQRVIQVLMRDTKNHPYLGHDAFREVPLNDINSDESVFTPQPYVLHVPNPEKGRVYSIMQTVVPPYISMSNLDKVDLIIPPQFVEPIVNYAAYRAYKSMNGDEQTEIGSHYRAYINSCKETYKKGMVNYTMLTNMKGPESGFPSATKSEYERNYHA